MGDPAGVGPELCLRLLNEPTLAGQFRGVVVGNVEVLRRVAARLGWSSPALSSPMGAWTELPASAATTTSDASGSQHRILHIETPDLESLQPGRSDAATGLAAYSYVTAAIEAAQQGWVHGVTTGPLNKEALHAAGIDFPGHTEIFAERCEAPRWCMMQYSEIITCSFVTVHVGYLEAVEGITPARILDVIELTREALITLRQREPKLVVCGLNPHAGEHGLFGNREEERLIQPAIDRAQQLGYQVEGPLPPDTAFVPQKRVVTDAFICMVHDQGHIPVKALAFDSAVNTTLGLPIVRTSVDHGTALDIAWQGLANPGSLFSAIRLALKLASSRNQ